MFRTREWVTFVAGCLFILGAIMITVWSDSARSASSSTPSFVEVAADDAVSQSAAVIETTHSSGTKQLQSMREKIERYRATHDRHANQFVVATSLPSTTERNISSPADSPSIGAVQYCNNPPQSYTQPWPRSVALDEREGARVVHVEVEGAAHATASSPVLLQLPVYPRPSREPNCVPHNVIGIANDGSLIRNDEVNLYGLFSANTVVGYALDGFPIYGAAADRTTDQCGGAVGDSGYGYMINSERDFIVACFRAQPVEL